MLYDGSRQGAARLRLHRRGRRQPRGRRQEPHLDRRSARRHHQFPARHPAIRDLDRPAARGHDDRRRDLQSRQRRALHRRARQGRLPQRPAAARGRPPQAQRMRHRLRAAAYRPRRPRAVAAGDGGAAGRESQACAASAPPRSTWPSSPPAASTATGNATCSRGTSRPARSSCARPAASSAASRATTMR